jgi:hypothetical protein
VTAAAFSTVIKEMHCATECLNKNITIFTTLEPYTLPNSILYENLLSLNLKYCKCLFIH